MRCQLSQCCCGSPAPTCCWTASHQMPPPWMPASTLQTLHVRVWLDSKGLRCAAAVSSAHACHDHPAHPCPVCSVSVPAVIDAFGALEGEGGASDDDAFSDALSRQASLGASDCGEPPAGTPATAAPADHHPAAPPAGPQEAPQHQQHKQLLSHQAAASRRNGKPLLQRVMEALKQQGQLEQQQQQQQQYAPVAAKQQTQGQAAGSSSASQPEGAGQPPVTDAPAAPAAQQHQRQRSTPLPGGPWGRTNGGMTDAVLGNRFSLHEDSHSFLNFAACCACCACLPACRGC